MYGAWPVALLSANKQKVIIEGPVCDSSQVIGWHLKKLNNETDAKPPIHVSSFAFNSSILWDPERWGRPSSVQQTSQVKTPYLLRMFGYECFSNTLGNHQTNKVFIVWALLKQTNLIIRLSLVLYNYFIIYDIKRQSLSDIW